MARLTWALAALAVLLAATRADALGPASFDVRKRPDRPPDLEFNDAWGPKIAGTDAGNSYNPKTVDWSSVLESIRVVCRYEMRICNWATRSAFHDSGSNTISTATGSTDTTVVTGGTDASLLLTDETLRFENSYENFSSYVASVIRTLVGFYNISYADGLACFGAVAREMLSHGRLPVYTMMPARSDPYTGDPKAHFLVGRLDSNISNPAGVLPPPFLDVDGFVAYWSTHFDYGSNGAHYGVALLGSHGANDNVGCVRMDSGYYRGERRMFAWQAENTYYKDLLTTKFGAPLAAFPITNDTVIPPPGLDGAPTRSLLDRSDPWPKPLTQKDVMQCTFTSDDFKAEVASALNTTGDKLQQGRTPITGPEIGIEWVDTSKQYGPDVAPDTNTTRPRGYRSRRSCDQWNNCYDGWPYTMNDGFMGIAAQANPSTLNQAGKDVGAAIRRFRNNGDWWDRAYAQAYVRLVKNNVNWAPYTPGGKGLEISGWECKTWVSGDGGNKNKNLFCDLNCGRGGNCADVHYRGRYQCRCSTSPWGNVAKQKLYPNSTQTAVNGIVTGGNTAGFGRKLLATEVAEAIVGPRFVKGGAGAKQAEDESVALRKLKCPMALLRGAGLLA